jgi:hypothetical protein
VKPAPRAADLLAAGHPVLALDLFLTGAFLSTVSRTGRPASNAHFTAYNRTDDALRVQDILTAAAALAQLTRSDHVDVIAEGQAAAWAILARPLATGLIYALQIDPAALDTHDTESTLARVYVPHLLRLGGLATAAALTPEQS